LTDVQCYHTETMQKQQGKLNQGQNNSTNTKALGQPTKKKT